MVDMNMRVVEPRKLTTESRFKFKCHPGVSCFTECCGKTTIILTPYDILRLKTRLRMKAAEFLQKYTRMEGHDKSGLPMVIMDMPRFENRCPFVRPVTGCEVYSDRPATCRYYPIGQGTLITEEGLDEFYFYVREEHCRGYEAEDEWNVASWKADQGVDRYDEMNREWKIMMLRRAEDGGPVTDDRGNRLFAMVMYDLDQFRDFVFKSRFLSIFDVDDEVKEKIWDDDEELLKFGYQYIKMAFKIADADALQMKQAMGPGPGSTTMTF
ncbi:MAG: YkgJ family cysteine cluster protein [Syntrophobacterales bacterium]|nr:YkgJ family cysteine cluster protein [Syntrophobacterales bacterium]